MSLSPEPRVTSPLTGGDSSPDLSPKTTVQLPATTSTAPLPPTNTSVKMPIVIPASTRRPRTNPLSIAPAPRRRIVLPGVLIGGLLIITLASIFVAPLGNSQHTTTIAQNLGNLFSTSAQSNAIGTLQQVVTPTASQLSSGDTQPGACRGTDIWSTCATYTIASGIRATGQMQHPIQG